MKGTFKVIDGVPFVITKKGTENTFKLINVKRCLTSNIGPKEYETQQIWSVVPFTDKAFWAEGKPIPALIQGQKIKVATEGESAKVTTII